MNEMVDVVLLQPAAASYRFILPDGVRDSVRSFMRNMRSPVILANDVFQGDEERVNTTFARFVINSTLGVAGLFDVADGMGYPFHKEDFGQTLGTYGVGEGFYLVLPILGPSSVRDGSGLVVDTLMDPFRYIFSQQVQLARFATEGVDLRSRHIEAIEELKRDSVDFYARIRSLYRQHRENEINNGELLEDVPVPGFIGDGQDSSDDWAD
jgi:phospholipid-binding lipoprotein MlaA